jgi:outer membrane protein OmpA-like peptidoglycan-associated protein
MRAVLPLLFIGCWVGALPAHAQAPRPVTADTSSTVPTGDCSPGPYIVFFASDSAALNAEARQILSDFVAAQRNPCGSRQAMVAGYTDRSGSARHNLELSRRRAAAVCRFLAAHGIPMADLTQRAFGAGSPLDAGRDRLVEPQNRRVEIINFPAKMP